MLALMLLVSGWAVAGEQDWRQYMQQGAEAYKRGDYRAGITAYEGALREAEVFGESDARLATTLSWLGFVYNAQGRYSEAEPFYRRALANFEKALGPEHPYVATSLTSLATLYQAQGRHAEAEPLYRRALAIGEKTRGPEHPDVALILNNLAALYQEQGRYADAESLGRRALAIFEKMRGPEHPDVAQSLNQLAVLYRAQGRYPEAEPLYRRALAVREKALGPEHPDVAHSLNNLADLYQAQGRYADAEPLFRRALAIYEKALGPEHPYVATGLSNLAGLYRAQGRYADAEPLFRRALAAREKVLGPGHPEMAKILNNLAALYQVQGRYADAEPLYRRALAIGEKTLGPEHPDVATRLNNLAVLYRAQGRYAEAEPLYRRALAVREKALGLEHPDVAQCLNNLAALYQVQGRYADAEPLYRRALALHEKTLGPEHPDVAQSLNNLAGMYQAQKKTGQGLESARRGTGILARRFGTRSGIDARGVISEQRAQSWGFELHVSLAYAASQDAGAQRIALLDEALAAAQFARTSNTADQLARMSARQAAASDRLAQAARSRQDLLARWERLDADLLAEVSRPPARRQAAREVQLREQQQATRQAFEQNDAQIEKEFPQYRELTDPKPLRLDAAQKLLARDEALIALLTTGEETFVWVMRPGSADFRSVALPRKELAATVQSLRRQLDLGTGDPAQMLAKPFDVAAANELYNKLLGPIDKQLAGVKHLIVVPDGPLQSLPLGVLVTELPGAPLVSIGDHANVAWLAKKYAITTLPAVGSLRALRAFAKAAPAPDPFVGFGDPLLEGGRRDSRNANIAALFSHGAVANAEQVRKLTRLPETADELRAIAVALKAPADQLHLGKAATEAQVKKLDLSRFRNVAFATHGLMAGDFKGLAEPALVLTPPQEGSEIDDGLLTASEITQLKLNAEWVILSACNTAAPDGTPGAEGLSGLARAFFYAGARSLLVSHWAVSSDAAVALTTRMFDESSKGASKADALRRSMLALMAQTGKPYFAHPAFWAPFVVVGEGR